MKQDAFIIEGYEEQVKQLKSMMSDNPDFRRRVNAVIRQMLKEARGEISQDIKSEVSNDPRNAYRAVRSAVYRRILGGQVNILQRRKAGHPGNYQKPLKGLPKRGGNRWGRSERTKSLEGYDGMDRGFVLRFLNAGTTDRSIHSFTGRDGERHDLRTSKKGGNRGSIAGRNFFSTSSRKALENASLKMQELIDRIIAQEFI
ncbi:MAG: hypothetical protein II822_10435 [Prevotella sp.]|nr:hypothetical protein [Prevotella sp.]